MNVKVRLLTIQYIVKNYKNIQHLFQEFDHRLCIWEISLITDYLLEGILTTDRWSQRSFRTSSKVLITLLSDPNITELVIYFIIYSLRSVKRPRTKPPISRRFALTLPDPSWKKKYLLTLSRPVFGFPTLFSIFLFNFACLPHC